MSFVRTNISRKYGVVLLLLLVIYVGIGIAVQAWVPGWGTQEKTESLVLIILGLYFISSLIAFVVIISRPMHVVLKEMKAMLAGKTYHRIYSKRIDEWGVFGYFFNEVSKNMENISHTVQEGERMSSELTLATDIQKMVLPQEIPQVPGLDIYASTRPAAEIGGDSFDIIRSKHDNTFLYVGDVTGHGVPSGLVMMMVNTLLDTYIELYQSAYDVLVQTNRMLKPRIQSTMFMTLAMLRWDETRKEMFSVGCGHEHIATFHKTSNVTELRKTGGIALGMVPDNSKIIKEDPTPFEVGDFIILYTDGIAEAQNTSGEMFGVKRLQDLITKHAPQSPTAQDLFTSVMKEFGTFVEDQVQNDDITLMVIRRTE
jgi:serine phosphatase RsbU (regulator of sigma subunit)